MNKKIFILSLIVGITAFLLSSCSKSGYKELEGKWIMNLDMEYDYWSDLDEEGLLASNYEFDFTKDEVTTSWVVTVNNETIFKASCDGKWRYVKDKFEDSNAIGIIEIEYNLDSFREEKSINVTQNYAETFKSQLKEHNWDTTNHEGVDYFGYNVLSISGDEVVIEGVDGRIYWLRPGKYEDKVKSFMLNEQLKHARQNSDYTNDF